LVAWHVSNRRTQEEVEKFLWKAKRRFPTAWMPKVIRTDSFPGYYPAIMKVFDREVKHDKFKSFEEHSNNEIECFFRCKKRLPKFYSAETAEPYINIAMAGYNRIVEHEKLGKTPGEMCGLEALIWQDIIKNGDDLSYED
jgi:transposase-like protein